MLSTITETIAERILQRNAICDAFFDRESLPLARACAEMAERLRHGGRVFTFGRGAYATDAMHVSVEFIHPVLVGKRALPAVDVSMSRDASISALCTADDIAIAFGPPTGDSKVLDTLHTAKARGAMTIAWPGDDADYAVAAPSTDPHIHQELFELLGHSMYESVHVFLEHAGVEGNAPRHGEHTSRHGEPVERPLSLSKQQQPTDFLYPFLNESQISPETLAADVAASIREKARDANALREQIAEKQSANIAAAAAAIRERLDRGGRILTFGNGGSATDATDFAIDCIAPENGWPPIPALSLALEPAVITATANDVGTDVIFLRQLIAQCKPNDVAMAFSTSGGSLNVVAALEEARKRGLLAIALLGYDGGEIARRNLADAAIVVDCDYIPRIQEAQGTIYHVLREALTS